MLARHVSPALLKHVYQAVKEFIRNNALSAACEKKCTEEVCRTGCVHFCCWDFEQMNRAFHPGSVHSFPSKHYCRWDFERRHNLCQPRQISRGSRAHGTHYRKRFFSYARGRSRTCVAD